MKRLLLILLVFGLLRVETPADEPAVNNSAQAGHPQTICPVMGGAINTNLFVDAEGLRIYVCCPACLKAVKADPDCLQPWLDRGIFVQLNTASLLGRMGERTQATARTLLATGRVHFIGSDAHSAGARSPDLHEAVQALTELLGPDETAVLLAHNPAQLPAARPEAIRAPCARPLAVKMSWRGRLASLWR